MNQPTPPIQPRRPGPFGPAWALLPKDQQPLVLEATTKVSDAIERLVDNGYSQIPVKNDEGKIIGVFSWESFGKRVSDLRASKVKPTDLEVQHAMGPANFILPEVYIDTATNWSDVDCVLVGTAERLLGILSVSDVFGRLSDFAEAFVLLYEIEHEIRDLIHDVVDAATLCQLAKAMNVPPNSRIPTTLEEFTFSQYKSLICSKANWPTFEPIFATLRELVNADLDDINELRNTVFHFRRSISPKDTDRLRRFRDRLRYDREIFCKQRQEKVS